MGGDVALDVQQLRYEDADERVLPAVAVEAAGWAEMHGGLPPFPAEVLLAYRRVPDEDTDQRLLVAGDPADPDGMAWIGLEAGGPNTHIGHVDVHVRPDRRRRGVGTVLQRAAEEVVAASGRTLAMGEAMEQAPSGRLFSRACGYDEALVLRCNRLLLDEVDRDLLEAWVADPDPAYELLRIDGRTPDDLVAPLIAAFEGMNDAPTGELDVNDDEVTEASMRSREAASAALDSRRLIYLARHRETGEGAGFTGVRWSHHQPTVIWQGGTATVRAHRGHGLGRLLKARMLLDLLAELPEAREVRTENAHSNAHMLAINDAMGFRPFTEQVVVQRRLEAAPS